MDDTARAELDVAIATEAQRFVGLFRVACRTHAQDMRDMIAGLFDVGALLKELNGRCCFLGAAVRTLDEEFVERRELTYAVAKDMAALEKRLDGFDPAFDEVASVISRDLFTLKRRLQALEEKCGAIEGSLALEPSPNGKHS